MSIVEFRLHQNSNIKIKVATQIGGATFFFVCRCWGVTPHIYSISRSLLHMETSGLLLVSVFCNMQRTPQFVYKDKYNF